MRHTGLPSEFRSLYRLFLRTNSAVVLHHSPSKTQVRRLWRPVFNSAASIIQRLERKGIRSSEREYLVQWLYTWHKRVDHTLSLLATAAVSRGLAHKITRNLKWLRQNHVLWVEKSYYAHRHYWKPQLPQTSEKYLPYPLPKPGSRPDQILRNNRKMRLFDEQCSNAIGEVVKMAEGRHGIILGRLHLKPWKHERSS
ncbi:hypothetical protein CY34DRAFT_613086 [Suillus luteus UH-Slu-Lm8-n1]|uniref:Uncharacterized protein n=1 Tax=Suillus luteus UH-Slu-Lm8-n1 TaxID=930992 RepID=A0A0C9ZZ80_9AGAM|nr:hypothetical protein CY34DRAFT_613086 [Suillus luteus UH-Slu-Lm8-n1]